MALALLAQMLSLRNNGIWDTRLAKDKFSKNADASQVLGNHQGGANDAGEDMTLLYPTMGLVPETKS